MTQLSRFVNSKLTSVPALFIVRLADGNWDYSQRVDYLLQRVSAWDFCPYDFDKEEQIHCAYLIFDQALSCTQMPENSISQGKI